MRFRFSIITSFILIVLILGCKDDSFIDADNATVSFSTDTLTFDTIFTEMGSATKRFKVYNPHDKFLKIDRLYVESGEASNFKINVDGSIGSSHMNIDIAPKDSLFIFVEVTLDPNGSNLPMIIEDHIIVESGNNEAGMLLLAFGQDVHLINGKIIKSAKWVNDKPYLIMNSMAVDSFHVLTIEKGVRVHFTDYSSMLVWGKLLVNGTLDEPVIFEGARFDRGYGHSAGRWGTIAIDTKSRDNILTYAHIRNATAGMQVGGLSKSGKMPSVELRNCVIQNSSAVGIYAFNAELTAYNTIVSDCLGQSVAMLMGGKYNFYHCTISSLGAFYAYPNDRYEAQSKNNLLFTNYLYFKDGIFDEYYNVVPYTYKQDLVEANFYNCIITGSHSAKTDVVCAKDTAEGAFNYKLDHCIYKAWKDSIDLEDTQHFNKVYLNQDSKFINDDRMKGIQNFHLDTLSAAKDSGSLELIKNIPWLEFDFEGKSRTADGMPDLGAFERVE